MSKFEETVKELKQDIEDLEESFKEKAPLFDEQTKAKASEVVEKTKTAINNSIDKVSAVIKDLKEDEKLDEFLDKVKAKSMEAVDFAKEKINAIANKENDDSIDKLAADVMSEFDKLKESEIAKKTTVILKQAEGKINEFLEKPEVKDAINKAKVTTINVAEKGVEGLKKVLKTDEIKNNDDQQ